MLGVCVLCVLSVVRADLVDLTHYNDETAATHPHNGRFKLTITHNGWWDVNPAAWLQNDEFFTPSHTGTHMDAPSHFRKGGWPVDEIPPERFISPAVVVDHQARSQDDSNDRLMVSDLLEWEAEYGRIPAGAMVLSQSGWSKYYKDIAKYYGNPDPETWRENGLNFPGFSEEAAEWLVQERKIFGVGTESLSIDPGNWTLHPAHIVFAAADVLMIENVGTGIHKIPKSGATVISLPIKNKGASGAPIRMLAYWGEDISRFAHLTASAGARKCEILVGTLVGILFTML